MAPLLAVEKLEVVYHRVATAVQGVTLMVERGATVALLGINGAGKTTTLRAISGFIGRDDARVTQGSVRYADTRIENLPPHRIAAMGVVLVPERDKVFENLTVHENLEAALPRRGAKSSTAQRAEMVYGYFPPLARLKAREAGYLSGGERQMLAIGSALMCEPELMLVDELSLGLSPIVVEELIERLARIGREHGLTMLIVEQNAAVALAIAQYGYVMENGRIVLDGTPQRLRAHQDIREFYLGHGQSADGERRSYRDVKQYRRSRRWYG
jgi:branched-chain amino acid transport system ATP-binding protein